MRSASSSVGNFNPAPTMTFCGVSNPPPGPCPSARDAADSDNRTTEARMFSDPDCFATGVEYCFRLSAHAVAQANAATKRMLEDSTQWIAQLAGDVAAAKANSVSVISRDRDGRMTKVETKHE